MRRVFSNKGHKLKIIFKIHYSLGFAVIIRYDDWINSFELAIHILCFELEFCYLLNHPFAEELIKKYKQPQPNNP